MDDPDDQVIDLAEYLERRATAMRSRNAFSFHGGDGERSRFALPLWRASYLGNGLRAGLVWLGPDAVEGEQIPEALVVLDLADDPARVAFPASCLSGLVGAEAAGQMAVSDNEVAIYLGVTDEKRWYLVVDDFAPVDEDTPEELADDIIFLAGECFGLLSFRGLAAGTGEED